MINKAVVLAILTATSLAAQTPPGQAPPDSKIDGRLVNAVTNEPVRKAKVSLHPSDPSKTVYTVESDAEGKFHLEKLDPGRYTLQGEKQGFVATWYGAKRPDGPGSTIELKQGKDVSELLLKLTPQGVIAGRVLDDESEPVSGVMVMALHYMYMNGHRQLIPVPNAMQIQTNDLGEYRLANLPPGKYYIESSAQKMTSVQTGSEKAQGNAPEEGLIPVYFPNSPDPSAASPVEVGPGAEVRGIDLKLKKSRVMRVSGKVTDAATGEPLKGGVIMLYRRSAGVMSVVPSSMFVVQGGKGEFELRGVAPGEYNVMAMATSDPQNMKMSMSRLDVGDQGVKDYVLNVGAGTDVQIAARLAPGVVPPSSKGGNWDLGSVRITLQVDENPLASLAATQLGKDGSGVLKHVNPDKYQIMVSGIPPDDYLLSARVGNVDVLENGFDLRNGVAGPLELTIGAPAAKITGTVRNDQGELVSGAVVTVVGKDPKSRTDMAHSATTDQNGHFQIAGMVPAEYRAYAWEDIELGAGEDPEFRKPFENMRADVDLSRGVAGSPVELKLISRAAVLDAQSRKQ
jgi:hypothetical protein